MPEGGYSNDSLLSRGRLLSLVEARQLVSGSDHGYGVVSNHNDHFTTNLPPSHWWKELWKSVNILRSYIKSKNGSVFIDHGVVCVWANKAKSWLWSYDSDIILSYMSSRLTRRQWRQTNSFQQKLPWKAATSRDNAKEKTKTVQNIFFIFTPNSFKLKLILNFDKYEIS